MATGKQTNKKETSVNRLSLRPFHCKWTTSSAVSSSCPPQTQQASQMATFKPVSSWHQILFLSQDKIQPLAMLHISGESRSSPSSQTSEGHLNSIIWALPTAFLQPIVKLCMITQMESSAVVLLINTVFLSVSFSFSLSEHQTQFYRGHHSWEKKILSDSSLGAFSDQHTS